MKLTTRATLRKNELLEGYFEREAHCRFLIGSPYVLSNGDKSPVKILGHAEQLVVAAPSHVENRGCGPDQGISPDGVQSCLRGLETCRPWSRSVQGVFSRLVGQMPRGAIPLNLNAPPGARPAARWTDY